MAGIARRMLNAALLDASTYEEVEADIRRALEDEHWLVQKIAARSLLELQDEMLYDALEELLGDEEEDIMQAVIESSFFELLENSDD